MDRYQISVLKSTTTTNRREEKQKQPESEQSVHEPRNLGNGLPSVHVGPVKEVRSQSQAGEIHWSWQTPRLAHVSGLQMDTARGGAPRVVRGTGGCNRLARYLLPSSLLSSAPSKAACALTKVTWNVDTPRADFTKLNQGCQIFLDTIYQNGGQCPKLTLNYQMAIKCTK
jgi:hypothetical protein